MMNKDDSKLFWDSAVAVAMTCSAQQRPASDAHPADVAEYIGDILASSTGMENETFFVFPMRYPEAAKKPYLIFDRRGGTRLLWYYPSQTDEQLRDGLSDVLMDLIGDRIRATA